MSLRHPVGVTAYLHVRHYSFVECDVSHSHMWCVSWLIHSRCAKDSDVTANPNVWLICLCDMTHSSVWHDWLLPICVCDSFVYVTWLIHLCDMVSCCQSVCHDSFIYVIWRDSLLSVWYGWLLPIRTCDSFVRVTSAIICVTWRINLCDMTHSYVRRDWLK